MQKLFEYAVLYHPKLTKEEKDAGTDHKPSVLVVEPTHVLAADEKVAAMVVARAIPEEYVDKLDKVEILIRPF